METNFKIGILFAFVLACMAPDARPAVSSWTGAGGSDNWSDAGNWQGGIVPTGGDDVAL